MEFKYRAVDDKRPATTSYPLATVTYVSDRSLRGAGGGFSSMPNGNTFRVPVASEALRREIEKEQIRREIIAGEIALRRELEEEVRRELALERSLGMPMQRSLAAPFSFQERLATTWSNPRMDPVVVDDIIAALPQPQLPQIMASAPAETKPSPQIDKDKDKVIMLAKPDPDLYSAKRKAATPAVFDTEPSAFGLKKRPTQEWSCALCKVSATSEMGLNEHLNGRKHKAKEASLRTQKIGLDAKADRQSPQPCITLGDIGQTMVDKGATESKNEEQLVHKSQNIDCLEKQNGTAAEEAGKVNALTRRKVQLWCEICQICTYSQVVMEGHRKGKKHLRRMEKFNQNNASIQNNVSALPTSSESQEAPVLIKDTDAHEKEIDQKITPVLNEETIEKMEECFSNSDEVP